MRKTDQVLMWEAFEGSISQGGPLGGSSTPSKSQSTTTEQGEEEPSEGLMGLVAQLLLGVEDGSIDEGEAVEHLKMVLSGEVEESEHETDDEQDMEDSGDYSAHDEDAEDDDEDDKPIKKLSFPSKTKHGAREGFTKEKGASNFKRPHSAPVRDRDTTRDQRGI